MDLSTGEPYSLGPEISTLWWGWNTWGAFRNVPCSCIRIINHEVFKGFIFHGDPIATIPGYPQQGISYPNVTINSVTLITIVTHLNSDTACHQLSKKRCFLSPLARFVVFAQPSRKEQETSKSVVWFQFVRPFFDAVVQILQPFASFSPWESIEIISFTEVLLLVRSSWNWTVLYFFRRKNGVCFVLGGSGLFSPPAAAVSQSRSNVSCWFCGIRIIRLSRNRVI